MSYLPKELLSIVLSKSQVKSLLRFRCVSKSWLKLIDSSYLINLHLNHNKQNSNDIMFFGTKDWKVTSIYGMEFDANKVEIRNLEPHPIPVRPYFTLACNSLLCLSWESRDKIEFWNPTTHKYRQLLIMSPQFTWRHRFGFGYDYRTDDYKLVMLEPHYILYGGTGAGRDRRDVKEMCFTVQVYSLKSNLWRPGPEMPKKKGHGNYLDNTAIYAGGVLYWTDHYAIQQDSGEGEYEIVAFDLATENWISLPPPVPSPLNGGAMSDLILSNHCGSLCATFYNKDDDHLDFWVLMKSDEEEQGIHIHSSCSWSKLFTIKEPHFDGGYIRIIYIPKENLKKKKMNQHQKLVLICSNNTHQFKWYDIEKETTEDIDDFDAFFVVYSLTCYQGLARV